MLISKSMRVSVSRAKGKAAPRGGAGTAFKGCSGSKALSRERLGLRPRRRLRCSLRALACERASAPQSAMWPPRETPGVFDGWSKCLLGIISRKLSVEQRSAGLGPPAHSVDIAKYFIPTSDIKAFTPRTRLISGIGINPGCEPQAKQSSTPHFGSVRAIQREPIDQDQRKRREVADAACGPYPAALRHIRRPNDCADNDHRDQFRVATPEPAALLRGEHVSCNVLKPVRRRRSTLNILIGFPIGKQERGAGWRTPRQVDISVDEAFQRFERLRAARSVRREGAHRSGISCRRFSLRRRAFEAPIGLRRAGLGLGGASDRRENQASQCGSPTFPRSAGPPALRRHRLT